MSKWKKPDTGGHEPCESVSGNHLGPIVKSLNAPGLPGAVEGVRSCVGGEGCASEPWGCLELDRAGGCLRHGPWVRSLANGPFRGCARHSANEFPLTTGTHCTPPQELELRLTDTLSGGGSLEQPERLHPSCGGVGEGEGWGAAVSPRWLRLPKPTLCKPGTELSPALVCTDATACACKDVSRSLSANAQCQRNQCPRTSKQVNGPLPSWHGPRVRIARRM